MKTKTIYIILLFVLKTINISSQEGILYTLKDGLSNSLINEVCQDNEGFIWVATDYGLNRFDGINFKTFNLGSNNTQIVSTNKFNAVCFDRQGRLLVGSEKGLYHFDQNNELFNLISIPEIPELSKNQISNILIDNENHLWLSISGLGIICLNQDSNNQYSLKSKHFQPNLSDVSCLFQDSNGYLWVGTRSHGAFKIDVKSTNIEHYHLQGEEELSIVGDCVYTITEDQNKNIIIGIFGYGISIISPSPSLNKWCFL